MRGGATGWTGGGGGRAVKFARTQDAHFRLSSGDGLRCLDTPSASCTTRIWSPEHRTMGEPVAVEAATADGSIAPNTMAKVAARNASDRNSDQCSVEDARTPRPYFAGRVRGRASRMTECLTAGRSGARIRPLRPRPGR